MWTLKEEGKKKKYTKFKNHDFTLIIKKQILVKTQFFFFQSQKIPIFVFLKISNF